MYHNVGSSTRIELATLEPHSKMITFSPRTPLQIYNKNFILPNYFQNFYLKIKERLLRRNLSLIFLDYVLPYKIVSI